MIQRELSTLQLMSREEATLHVAAVNNAALDMGKHLKELKSGQGWKALGYHSWTAMLAGEFTFSRQYLYELMSAAPVLEKLSTTVDNFSTKAATALAQFDEELHPTIVKTAQPRYGVLTESNVNRIGSIVQEMTLTGHVDTGNGTSTPIDAALDVADDEADKRKKQYAADGAMKNDALYTSKSYEWYTPPDLISAVVRTLGPIELDPCSTLEANEVVCAVRILTLDDDSIKQSWQASTVYMNPPYGDGIDDWMLKLATEYERGNIGAAVALVPARTDTAWWRRLRQYPRCFISGRIKFTSPTGTDNSAPFPSAAIYLGTDIERFASAFHSFGDIFELYRDSR